MNSLFDLQPHYDAVIVGARCAGAATALVLARSGAKVLVVDRQAYGSDTMSTHALMRGAVIQLTRWGLIPEITAQTRFTSPSSPSMVSSVCMRHAALYSIAFLLMRPAKQVLRSGTAFPFLTFTLGRAAG
jgi:flavin-dependent dehydrogenase